MGRLYVFGRRVVVRGLRVLRRLAACRVYVPLRHVAMDRLYVHVHVRGVVAVQLCVLGWRVVAWRPHDPCPGGAAWRTGCTRAA